MGRARLLGVFSAAIVLIAAVPANARVPGRGTRARLDQAVQAPLSLPPAAADVAGIVVLRGGRPMISINMNTPLTPASLSKLAVTTAALAKFGPTHRFVTRIFGAKPERGIVHGSITLVGGGDPAFSTRAFVQENFIPKPNDPAPVAIFPNGMATVEDLAAALRKAGVRRIDGGITVDESLFDSERTRPGWLPSYQKQGSVEIGNLSALPVNMGFADVKATTVSSSPATSAGNALSSALRGAGISVGGGVRAGRARGAELARVAGPTLSDVVFWTNKFSINYAAELLLKDLGAAYGGAGTTQAGLRVERTVLGALGIPLDGFAMKDGSGLSLDDRMAPATIAALISHALADRSPAGAALRASFPVAGGPGTLWNRMKVPPARGNLRGKTGFLRGVRGLAGWVTAEDGSTLVYVALFNGSSDPGSLGKPLDWFGATLARFPYA